MYIRRVKNVLTTLLEAPRNVLAKPARGAKKLIMFMMKFKTIHFSPPFSLVIPPSLDFYILKVDEKK